MQNDLTFITVCKGRLPHLRQTLPLLAAQQGTQSLVVDYGCPDGTRHWVRENCPGVTVVSVDDDPGLCLSRARNLGAAAATTPLLCFIDADIMIDADLIQWLRNNRQDLSFYRALPPDQNICGTMICARSDFSRAGGYDEAIRGWGGEDDDLYMRLQDIGCRQAGFPASLLKPIKHGDAERVAFYDIKDRWISHQIGQVYLLAKADITRFLGRSPSLEERRGVYEEARKGVFAAHVSKSDIAVLEVVLPLDSRLPAHVEWKIEHKIVYRILPRRR